MTGSRKLSAETNEHIIHGNAAFGLPQKNEWLDRMFRSMGYPDGETVNPVIYDKALGFLDSVGHQAAPLFYFKSVTLDTVTKKGFTANGLTIKSRNWGRTALLMENPKEVCCFGLTLGERVEDTNRKLARVSNADAYIWDALCSTLAEYYADQAESYLGGLYKTKGWEISRRFSPGYCDLALVADQDAIFGLCDFDAIGIRLSASGLMTPRKSITGMVLVAERLSLSMPCYFCKRECTHRRC